MRARRREVLASICSAALARPAVGQPAAGAAAGRVLRFAPIADLGVLDPIVTTTYIARNHGYLVWDTLYGPDEQVRPQPQMAEGHAVEEAGRRVTIRLRPGLRFHDGEPVLARDCVASIRRWGARDPLGQTLLSLTDALEAPDDRTVLFRLRGRVAEHGAALPARPGGGALPVAAAAAGQAGRLRGVHRRARRVGGAGPVGGDGAAAGAARAGLRGRLQHPQGASDTSGPIG
jgi:ABC-type transport system substrate-binding protein